MPPAIFTTLYHDHPPLVLTRDFETQELIVQLGARPIVLELNGFRASWGKLTPVGTGRFEVHSAGVLVAWFNERFTVAHGPRVCSPLDP